MVPRFLKRRWSKTPHELQLSAQKVFAWPSCEAKGAFEVSTWPFALGFLGEAGLGSSVLESVVEITSTGGVGERGQRVKSGSGLQNEVGTLAHSTM